MSPQQPNHVELIKDAIAVMTAWSSERDQFAFASETLFSVAEDRYPDNPADGFQYAAVALVSFCGLLLTQRRDETGVPIETTLGEMGQRWAAG